MKQNLTHFTGLGLSRRAGRAGFFRKLIETQLRALDSGVVELQHPDGTVTRLGKGDNTYRVVIRSPKFYAAVVLGGSVGAAHSYFASEWDCDDLVGLLRLFARDRSATDRMEGGLATLSTAAYRVYHRLRANSKRGSRRNISAHYDLSNDFFQLFLDETMTYSSGIFESDNASLKEASLAKIDRLCRKLDLSAEDHLLEIGTGWGSLAIHAAETYGCRVTTTTLSQEQARYARALVAARGLADRITVEVTDYRDLHGTFDKAVSVEMVEAVGHAHMPAYFEACGRLLKPDGVFAVQAITVQDQRYDIARKQVDIIQHTLFPGSDIPSVTYMLDCATKASTLRLFHLEDISPHYARTLRHWRERFHAKLGEARGLGLDEEFLRLWTYYLSYCEAGFAEHYTGCVQMVFTQQEAMHPPILGRLAEASETA